MSFAQGGGTYKEEGKKFKEELDAKVLIMLVYQGKKGHGIFVSGDIKEMAKMPVVLRLLADELEANLVEYMVNKIAQEQEDKN
jgi:hypothetical protein